MAIDSSCLNCGAPLSGRFCAACGQKVLPPDPSLRDVTHEFFHELLHLDGRLFRTIRLLFTRPGFLTREMGQGRRARYIGPVRLYLTFSILFFAVLALTPATTMTREDSRLGTVMSRGGWNYSGERLLQGRSADQISEILEHVDQVWQPRLLFLMVPVLALLCLAMTRRPRRKFPYHLYFALHTKAALFAAVVLLRPARLLLPPAVVPWLALAGTAFAFWYVIAAVRCAYDERWPGAVLRGTAILVSYVILLQIGVALMQIAALMW